jgi:hypothetical protein
VSNLDIHSEKRGAWHVVAQPSGLRVTFYSLPNKRAAQAARDAITAGVPDFPWGADTEALRAAVRNYRDDEGRPLTETISRALAAVPAADPQGWNRNSVESLDASRTAHREFVAREDADGYTEPVKLTDIEIGDEISFKYLVLRGRRSGFVHLPWPERNGTATVLVRGTVTGEGRIMDRSGNNMYESVSGMRFPLAGATWRDDDGNSGSLERAVTVDWLETVRRRPRKG